MIEVHKRCTARGVLTVVAVLSLAAPAVARPAGGGTPQEAGAAGQGEAQELPALELSLFQAVEMALRHNLQVRIAAFSPDLQEEQITSARARFDPTFRFDLPQTFNRDVSQGTNQLSGADVLTSETISGGFQFSQTLEYGTNWSLAWNTNRNVTNSAFSTFNPRISATTTLQVTQPLLRDFGKEVNRQQILVAQNGYRQSREQFRQQVQQIIFQVYQAYWELVFAQRDLEVKKLSLDLARQQLERNRIQVEIGTLAPIETIQAEQQVASRELQMTQAEVALKDAEDDLKRLINVEAASPNGWNVRIVPSDEPVVETAPIDVEAAIAEALEHDPQLLQDRINLDTRELNIRVARNQLLPQVNFTGSIRLSGLGGDRLITAGGLGSGSLIEVQKGGFRDALRNMISGDFRNWSLGLTVSFPLNNWGARAQHAQAVINQQSALAQIADREQQLRVDVMKAARAVETGMQQVRQAQVARELAERQLEAEERKFAVGSTTNFQVLDFQRQLADARSAELRAIINFNNALARLEQAKGTLLESLGVSIAEAGVPGKTTARRP